MSQFLSKKINNPKILQSDAFWWNSSREKGNEQINSHETSFITYEVLE